MITTIRKPGSEIWVSFNPELETDDTYKRFVVSPPPGAVVVKTSWRDNPARSDELRTEIEHLKATDPDEHEHVYEGMCRQAVTGAVYRNELLAADKEGRICRASRRRRRSLVSTSLMQRSARTASRRSGISGQDPIQPLPCTARRKNGEPCGAKAIRGGNVRRMRGRRTPG